MSGKTVVVPVEMTKAQARALGGKGKRGGSFFGSLVSGAKTLYKKVLKPIYNVAKDTKFVSKGADALGFSNVGDLARKVGLGKRRVMRKRGGAVPKIVLF